MENANLWNRILKHVEARINGGSFETWFKPTNFISHAEGVLQVEVPNPLFRDWLTNNYGTLVREACETIESPPSRLEYVVRQPDVSGAPARAVRSAPSPVAVPSRGSELNPKYRFETFVVGGCNQFAHAAASAVADGSVTSYNPLFLYGGVGLGKTHLMHAIGHHARTHNPNALLLYISAENFMNDLVNAIRFDRTHEFRNRYRTIDLLLIDDIQFLAGKERTQEEFFHTFNALYEAQKRIVISSDRTPKDIPTLEERLHSRFEWGLIADIQPPDFETKVAILKRKADLERIHLDDDVAMYIANQFKSNIRELEGSLIRLLAFASMTGKPMDLELAKEVLSGVLAKRAGEVAFDRIIQVVTEHYGLTPTQLLSRSNSRAIAQPRQVAMYLSKKVTKASFPQIGRAFGGKHHTTVMHSVSKVEESYERDSDFRRTIQGLMESLR